MITNGETCVLILFNDEAALAAAVIGILQERDCHSQICDKARRSVAEFGACIVADRWKALLQTTLPPGVGVANS